MEIAFLVIAVLCSSGALSAVFALLGVAATSARTRKH